MRLPGAAVFRTTLLLRCRMGQWAIRILPREGWSGGRARKNRAVVFAGRKIWHCLICANVNGHVNRSQAARNEAKSCTVQMRWTSFLNQTLFLTYRCHRLLENRHSPVTRRTLSLVYARQTSVENVHPEPGSWHNHHPVAKRIHPDYPKLISMTSFFPVSLAADLVNLESNTDCANVSNEDTVSNPARQTTSHPTLA
ncbi:hypothetical protein C8J56DRAFT_1082792 [Mycena floridula]|nr:hypothetical protein C8J56DRAFT_1082792 [Mycena floridula]